MLLACTDPVDPPPLPGPPDLPRWSTAPHVVWEGLAQTAAPTRPLALFIEAPGGPLDQVAHDADVATFLNDRFHAVFLTPERSGRPRGMWFLDVRGCLLRGPATPDSPAAWIREANAAMEAPAPQGAWPGVDGVAAGHPLSGACPKD